MISYIFRRLLLLPVTLFVILMVNFVILNMAPPESLEKLQLGNSGEMGQSADQSTDFLADVYLQFRERYGLTNPTLFNVRFMLTHKDLIGFFNEINKVEGVDKIKMQNLIVSLGDRAKYMMPYLLKEASNINNSFFIRQLAVDMFIRGGCKNGIIKNKMNTQELLENKKVSQENLFLVSNKLLQIDSEQEINDKITKLHNWFYEDQIFNSYQIKGIGKVKEFFTETMFCKYIQRIAKLDFGTLRNNPNEKVLVAAGKRLKHSLTLTMLPIILIFCLSQVFGMIMTIYKNSIVSHALRMILPILFAIPIFVAGPWLINFFSIKLSWFPHGGFQSQEAIYHNLTSLERLKDISWHLVLPIVSIMYGALAVHSRLSNAVFSDILNKDYVKTAKAKGLKTSTILFKYIGRNGAIVLVTSLAGSLGGLLSGSLIIEKIFDINGFGKFFYEAVVNRDYNVVLFSVFAGSFLTLLSYLIADVLYIVLDPRISLE